MGDAPLKTLKYLQCFANLAFDWQFSFQNISLIFLSVKKLQGARVSKFQKKNGYKFHFTSLNRH